MEDKNVMTQETIDRMHEYRKLLLANNFIEPKWQNLSFKEWRFFKQVTGLTAFAVNLEGIDKGVKVVYGYASTAFTLMKGCENSLIDSGIWNQEMNIREMIIIPHEMVSSSVSDRIKRMYDEYINVEKVELLNIAKQKRKEFINQIAVRLKPLGFKKKGNSWKKFLDGEFYLMFEAQKSSFSDEYYFNVIINTDNRGVARECFYCRIFPEQLSPLDWQLYPNDKFISFLDNDVMNQLSFILNTPLKELGKERMIWEGCTCERDNCNICWVEKNLWDVDKDEKEKGIL